MNTEIDISNVILHTDRMILRPWRQTDLDDLYAYASVDGVGQMAGWKPHESKEESQIILDMFIGHKKTFALEYQGKVIGSLGIEQYNEDHFPEFADKKCREIGYVLSKEYWGQGLMPEAVKEVIRYKSLEGSHSAREDTEVSAGNVPVAEREGKTEKLVCQVRSKPCRKSPSESAPPLGSVQAPCFWAALTPCRLCFGRGHGEVFLACFAEKWGTVPTWSENFLWKRGWRPFFQEKIPGPLRFFLYDHAKMRTNVLG